MPFPVPSRDDLTAQIIADEQARIPGADLMLRVSVLGILARVWAGALALIWGFLGRYWVKQFFIDSAESPYLERRVSPYGITPEGATPAAGNVVFGGTNGIPIPAGTLIQTPPGSSPTVLYATQVDVSIAGAFATVAVVATTGGLAGNQLAGAALPLYAGIAGIQPAASVDFGGLTGGTDIEADDALRARGLQRIRQPPQGGAWFDYVAWAKTVAGVTRVWVYPLNRGLGTVDVTFVMDGRTNNVPLLADVVAVQAAIDNLRPVTADVMVFAPTTAALSITITGMVPGDATTRGNVVAQLHQLARQVAPGGAQYGDGVSLTGTSPGPGGFLYLSQIEAAVQAAGGVAHFDLTVPAADVVYGTGVIPAAPTVVFV